MKELSVTDRLTFLAKSFDVFECNEKTLEERLSTLELEGYKPRLISKKYKKDVLAIVSVTTNKKSRTLTKVSICSDVFAEIIAGDPTENKMYVQWMLNLFVRLLKDSDNKESVEAAIRFVTEDLPQANSYLTLFNDNKRKKKFDTLCKASFGLKHIKDPSDINQFMSLSQLFDAVDPFIEKEPSNVERQLNKYVEVGQALIPVRDRKFTLYIPKTTDASVVFEKFASWCTARTGNSNFTSYTTNNKKPNGKNSDIYIIINNKFFSGESEEVFQIHFETNQIKDKKNSETSNFFENVISQSDSLSKFFYEELMGMAKDWKKGIENNKYLDYLIQFGFAESLFEFLDEGTPTIKFMKREIPKLPDLSRFKNLDQLIICEAKMKEIHPSIGNLTKLDMLVLSGNNLETLPKEIGSLKNLQFINIIGNKIKTFPDEIAYLDKSKGGRLYKISVRESEIGKDNYRRLKELLPTTVL